MEGAEVVKMDSIGATASLLILATVINHDPDLLVQSTLDTSISFGRGEGK